VSPLCPSDGPLAGWVPGCDDGGLAMCSTSVSGELYCREPRRQFSFVRRFAICGLGFVTAEIPLLSTTSVSFRTKAEPPWGIEPQTYASQDPLPAWTLALTRHFTCTIGTSREPQPPQMTPVRSTNGSTPTYSRPSLTMAWLASDSRRDRLHGTASTAQLSRLLRRQAFLTRRLWPSRARVRRWRTRRAALTAFSSISRQQD
jgi:hypothetical protein